MIKELQRAHRAADSAYRWRRADKVSTIIRLSAYGTSLFTSVALPYGFRYYAEALAYASGIASEASKEFRRAYGKHVTRACAGLAERLR